MATIEVTEDNFGATVASGIVLLDFWADWCAPCRAFAPIFEAAAEKHPDITFGKIDSDQQRSLSQRLQVRGLPTLMVLRDGIMLLSQPGLLPADALEDIIAKVRELDMDEVRREIDAASDSPPS